MYFEGLLTDSKEPFNLFLGISRTLSKAILWVPSSDDNVSALIPCQHFHLDRSRDQWNIVFVSLEQVSRARTFQNILNGGVESVPADIGGSTRVGAVVGVGGESVGVLHVDQGQGQELSGVLHDVLRNRP